MYAQAVWFDGPRSAELVAASDRAADGRIEPALRQHAELIDDLVATLVLRRPDGGELVVTITGTAETLQRGSEVIMSTTLVPDEDPALLRDPDRIEVFEVVRTMIGHTPLR